MVFDSLCEQPVTAQIEWVQRGFPSRSLELVSRDMGVAKKTLLASLAIPLRTVSARERAKARFSVQESEKIFRVVQIRHALRKLFTSKEAIDSWMFAPDEALGGKTPAEMLQTDLGAAEVRNLVQAMIHGVPI